MSSVLKRVARVATGVCIGLGLSVALSGSVRAADSPAEANARARKFVESFVADLRPLEHEVNLAWWEASISGRDEDFARRQAAQDRIDSLLADPARFQELKRLHEAGGLNDPLLTRQIEVLYLLCLEKQVDPLLLREMNVRSTAIEKAFNVYRARVDGQELTGNEVGEVLRTSPDSERRRAVWEASKGVGAVVEKDLLELVRLRNQSAEQLGFRDFHQMKMFLAEQDQAEILKLFDELDELTREPFRRAKAEIDERLAAHCGISVQELRPWHYHDPFFQESPAVFGTDPDAIFRGRNIPELCRVFYAGIGLPVDDVLARSDLFEKPGKSPHAFCTDIDREGDVRVLANVVSNDRWMQTMLHELGHAVYSSKNMPGQVPYLLRDAAHILTTEGIAMMFGRLSKNGVWQQRMGIAPADPQTRQQLSTDAARVLRNQLLIFSRWCQVMLRFEKELYGNPDQDLNRLWWDLVERYQLVQRPEGRNSPDYASKIHIVVAPVYYHNYMMGELFASQLHHAIARDVYDGADPRGVVYINDPRVGTFLREKVFQPGRIRTWNDLTRFATGQPLSPAAFAADFESAR